MYMLLVPIRTQAAPESDVIETWLELANLWEATGYNPLHFSRKWSTETRTQAAPVPEARSPILTDKTHVSQPRTR